MTALLVATAGGHLAQLRRLAELIPDLRAERTWVTFDTPQSRSLLRGEPVIFVPRVGSRDWTGVARTVRYADRILATKKYDQVWSTGAAIALAFLPVARARGIASSYVESAARATGPSVTGRLLEPFRGINLYTQYPALGNRRWRYGVSVFDGYEAEPAQGSEVTRVVVTVGSMYYPFERLIRRVEEIAAPDTEITWQAGPVVVRRTDALRTDYLPHEELQSAMKFADAVVAHAGIGSALSALESGRIPVLVPRRKHFGEHVDDHQCQIASELDRRGLAIAVDADQLEWPHLELATRIRLVSHESTGDES